MWLSQKNKKQAVSRGETATHRLILSASWLEKQIYTIFLVAQEPMGYDQFDEISLQVALANFSYSVSLNILIEC